VEARPLPRRSSAQRWAIWIVTAWCVLAGTALSQPSYSEDVVKAVLLERIVTFLSWSGAAAASGSVDVVVLGQGALGHEVERVYARRSFAGRTIKLRHAARPQEIGNPQIVIIGHDYAQQLPAVLKECAHEGVLTVGDTPGFGARGVAINFYRDGTRVRFEIAPGALKRARIQASYKLLALARVVEEP
jgi:hypothetical protein